MFNYNQSFTNQINYFSMSIVKTSEERLNELETISQAQSETIVRQSKEIEELKNAMRQQEETLNKILAHLV